MFRRQPGGHKAMPPRPPIGPAGGGSGSTCGPSAGHEDGYVKQQTHVLVGPFAPGGAVAAAAAAAAQQRAAAAARCAAVGSTEPSSATAAAAAVAQAGLYGAYRSYAQTQQLAHARAEAQQRLVAAAAPAPAAAATGASSAQLQAAGEPRRALKRRDSPIGPQAARAVPRFGAGPSAAPAAAAAAPPAAACVQQQGGSLPRQQQWQQAALVAQLRGSSACWPQRTPAGQLKLPPQAPPAGGSNALPSALLPPLPSQPQPLMSGRQQRAVPDAATGPTRGLVFVHGPIARPASTAQGNTHSTNYSSWGAAAAPAGDAEFSPLPSAAQPSCRQRSAAETASCKAPSWAAPAPTAAPAPAGRAWARIDSLSADGAWGGGDGGSGGGEDAEEKAEGGALGAPGAAESGVNDTTYNTACSSLLLFATPQAEQAGADTGSFPMRNRRSAGGSAAATAAAAAACGAAAAHQARAAAVAAALLRQQRKRGEVSSAEGRLLCARVSVYTDTTSPCALAVANEIMSRVALPGGVPFAPVSPDSVEFQMGVAWGFPAFAVALGASYFRRLLAGLPHLGAAAASVPEFAAYWPEARLQQQGHCPPPAGPDSAALESTLRSAQATCIFLATKVADQVRAYGMLRFMLSVLGGRCTVSAEQASEVELRCLSGLNWRLGPFFAEDDFGNGPAGDAVVTPAGDTAAAGSSGCSQHQVPAAAVGGVGPQASSAAGGGGGGSIGAFAAWQQHQQRSATVGGSDRGGRLVTVGC